MKKLLAIVIVFAMLISTAIAYDEDVTPNWDTETVTPNSTDVTALWINYENSRLVVQSDYYDPANSINAWDGSGGVANTDPPNHFRYVLENYTDSIDYAWNNFIGGSGNLLDPYTNVRSTYDFAGGPPPSNPAFAGNPFYLFGGGWYQPWDFGTGNDPVLTAILWETDYPTVPFEDKTGPFNVYTANIPGDVLMFDPLAYLSENAISMGFTGPAPIVNGLDGNEKMITQLFRCAMPNDEFPIGETFVSGYTKESHDEFLCRMDTYQFLDSDLDPAGVEANNAGGVIQGDRIIGSFMDSDDHSDQFNLGLDSIFPLKSNYTGNTVGPAWPVTIYELGRNQGPNNRDRVILMLDPPGVQGSGNFPVVKTQSVETEFGTKAVYSNATLINFFTHYIESNVTNANSVRVNVFSQANQPSKKIASGFNMDLTTNKYIICKPDMCTLSSTLSLTDYTYTWAAELVAIADGYAFFNVYFLLTEDYTYFADGIAYNVNELNFITDDKLQYISTTAIMPKSCAGSGIDITDLSLNVTCIEELLNQGTPAGTYNPERDALPWAYQPSTPVFFGDYNRQDQLTGSENLDDMLFNGMPILAYDYDNDEDFINHLETLEALYQSAGIFDFGVFEQNHALSTRHRKSEIAFVGGSNPINPQVLYRHRVAHHQDVNGINVQDNFLRVLNLLNTNEQIATYNVTKGNKYEDIVWDWAGTRTEFGLPLTVNETDLTENNITIVSKFSDDPSVFDPQSGVSEFDNIWEDLGEHYGRVDLFNPAFITWNVAPPQGFPFNPTIMGPNVFDPIVGGNANGAVKYQMYTKYESGSDGAACLPAGSGTSWTDVADADKSCTDTGFVVLGMNMIPTNADGTDVRSFVVGDRIPFPENWLGDSTSLFAPELGFSAFVDKDADNQYQISDHAIIHDMGTNADGQNYVLLRTSSINVQGNSSPNRKPQLHFGACAVNLVGVSDAGVVADVKYLDSDEGTAGIAGAEIIGDIIAENEFIAVGDNFTWYRDGKGLGTTGDITCYMHVTSSSATTGLASIEVGQNFVEGTTDNILSTPLYVKHIDDALFAFEIYYNKDAYIYNQKISADYGGYNRLNASTSSGVYTPDSTLLIDVWAPYSGAHYEFRDISTCSYPSLGTGFPGDCYHDELGNSNITGTTLLINGVEMGWVEEAEDESVKVTNFEQMFIITGVSNTTNQSQSYGDYRGSISLTLNSLTQEDAFDGAVIPYECSTHYTLGYGEGSNLVPGDELTVNLFKDLPSSGVCFAIVEGGDNDALGIDANDFALNADLGNILVSPPLEADDVVYAGPEPNYVPVRVS